MIDSLCIALIATVLTTFLAPRTFSVFDRRLALARLAGGNTPRAVVAPSRAAQGTAPSVSPHDVCENLASAVLSGEASRDALVRLVSEHRVPEGLREVCDRHMMSPEPFGTVIQRLKNDLAGTEHHGLGVLLALCVTSDVFSAPALRTAAGLLQSEAALEQLTASHTAHARLTVRALSLLPVVFIGFAAVTSRSFRSVMCSFPGVACLAVAAGLNLAGRLWATRLISRAGRPNGDQGVHLLVTGFCVSINAGHSIVGACLGLGRVNDCGLRIARRLEGNEPLESALDELVQEFGDTGNDARRLILDGASSGLPVHRSADRLAESMHQRRASATAARAQQLSTALSMPVVLCLLPSFVVAVLIPLVIASMSSLAQAA